MRKLAILLILLLIPSVSADNLDLIAGCHEEISLRYETGSLLFFTADNVPEGFTVEFSPNPNRYGTTMYVNTTLDTAPGSYSFDVLTYVQDEKTIKTIYATGTMGVLPPEEEIPPMPDNGTTQNETTQEVWYFEGKSSPDLPVFLIIPSLLSIILLLLLWKRRKKEEKK